LERAKHAANLTDQPATAIGTIKLRLNFAPEIDLIPDMHDDEIKDDIAHDLKIIEAMLARGVGNLDPDADCFKPPPGCVVVECLHCGEEYDSYRIEWRVFDSDKGPQGFWCCPIEGCDGVGFGFDIFPVDPDECAQFGIEVWEDDEDENYDDEADWLDKNPGSSDDRPPSDSDDEIPY
jgi:hypothetical protein